MFDLISQWSHAGAAILFAALAVWVGRTAKAGRFSAILICACAVTASWALFAATGDPQTLISRIAESSRNLLWLGFMFALWRQGAGERKTATVVILYSVIGCVVALQIAVDTLPVMVAGSEQWINTVFFASLVLRMITAVGALVLVHNLYTAATPTARSAIRLPMVALTMLWAYDLNLYTTAYLAGALPTELAALRGLATMLVVPLFALSASQIPTMMMRLSRTATFQSLSLVAIGGYLAIMVLISTALEMLAGPYARVAQVSVVFGISVVSLLLLPSARFRAWLRVKLSKHLFQHRYDYRAEWIRFTDTLGKPGDGADPLDTRIIQAVADITESPAGLLLVPDDHGGLIAQAHWNWPEAGVPTTCGNSATIHFFADTGRIVELDVLRGQPDGADDEGSAVPEWIVSDSDSWAIVPLVHFNRLAGLVILKRPPLDRQLDWEDLDLLRVVGRQVASYLAESQGQLALAHVQQFDEFNRRFAFIIHDIKNLVSQLALVTRNAERHADNPEFRADMIVTLKNSTARMNDLLARLSQHNKAKAADPQPTCVVQLLERVAATKRLLHPVVITGDTEAKGEADPARLEQAVQHLVQNAIEASPKLEPVCIAIHQMADGVQIDIIDQGIGMSGQFIRQSLFKPFASTKVGGFGIGAYEARSLINAMGGHLDVISHIGAGTTFRITLRTPQSTPFHNIEIQALVA